MPIEYEHKYLVSKIPSNNSNEQHIIQNYIGVSSDRSLVQRVRKIITTEIKYIETHKIGRGKFVHEVEHEIPKNSYDELVEFFTIGNPINKIRRVIEIDGLIWDVDQFENGMIVAELENPPNEYSLNGFGEHINISELSEFKNFRIALDGYPKYKYLFNKELNEK